MLSVSNTQNIFKAFNKILGEKQKYKKSNQFLFC